MPLGESEAELELFRASSPFLSAGGRRLAHEPGANTQISGHPRQHMVRRVVLWRFVE